MQCCVSTRAHTSGKQSMSLSWQLCQMVATNCQPWQDVMMCRLFDFQREAAHCGSACEALLWPVVYAAARLAGSVIFLAANALSRAAGRFHTARTTFLRFGEVYRQKRSICAASDRDARALQLWLTFGLRLQHSDFSERAKNIISSFLRIGPRKGLVYSVNCITRPLRISRPLGKHTFSVLAFIYS